MASLRSLRSQKKQTRLTFSPLPSSSPVKNKYSRDVQEKLAHVRYAGSKESQHMQHERDRNNDGGLPTPENSSQPVPQITVQANKEFSPLSDPPSSDILIYEHTNSPQEVEEEEEEDIQLPLPKRHKPDVTMKVSTPRRSNRLIGQPNSRNRESTTSASNQRSITIEIPSPSRRFSDFGSAETTGDEDNVISAKRKSRRQSHKSPTGDFVAKDDQIDFVSSDEDVVISSKKRKNHLPPAKDDFIVDDDQVEYLSSNEELNTPSRSRRLSRTQKSPRTVRLRSRREKQELEDDLLDLQDSDTVVKTTRTRGAPVNKERLKTRRHLEVLKRRRAGETTFNLEDSEDEREPVDSDQTDISTPVYISSGDGPSATESVDADTPLFLPGLDETEDDFIVDDTSSHRLGLPHPDMPLEFTSYASAKPRDLFIHIIEWLCKNKISPAFSRHDQIWTIAFNKIDDEVKAQAGSRLISSAWNAPFRRTLEARPNVKILRLPGHEEEHIRTCDACNRTNHPAQYDFLFHGKAYHQKSLEPVEDDEEEDDDAGQDEDNTSVDSKGHVLPPQSQHFYLGRYCAANAEMGHKLTHWLFHLNENLLAYLTEQGVMSADEIIKRDRMNHKKRERAAEAIVDEMREAGVIDELWKDFKNDVDDARIGMDGYEKRGGRSVGRIGTLRAQRDDGSVEEFGERRYREAPKLAEDSD